MNHGKRKMNRYNCKFIGRQKNALGITHFNEVEVEAETVDKAHFKLYETHESIFQFLIVNTLNNADFKNSKMIH